ncbi:MAG: hypothetical protein RL030_2433 [Pseudomonadota bacterium]|jgi:TonB family protein
MRLLLVLLALYGVPSLAADGDPTPSMPGSVYVPPRLVAKQNLPNLYPGFPDREALVYVSFLVGTDGRASSLTINEGGFYNKRFSDAALQFVSRVRFVPAMRDGVPVAVSEVMPVRFSVEGNRGVTAEFRSEMAKVVRLAQDKDYVGAHFHAQWMLAEKVQLNYEYAVLNYTIADTQARMGNVHRALIASRAATGRVSMDMEKYEPGGPIPLRRESDFTLSKGVLEAALRQRFALAASQGFFLEALRTHADLQGLGIIRKDDPTMATFEKVLSHVQTSPTLVANVQIDEDAYWDHDPLFSRLVVVGVKGGTLEGLELRCASQIQMFKIQDSVELSIPENARGCRGRFIGTPGTRFKLIELRDLPG